MGCRRLLAAACGVTLAGLALTVPGAAGADVKPIPPKAPELHGYNLTPSQPSGAGHYEWLGSYRVNGKQVWCVNYLYKAPRSNERYRPGDALRTKWNTAIPKDRAADISYLLLRHGNTSSNDEATAMAHILHSWTAPPAGGHPTRGVAGREVAYDAAFHLRTMPASARAKVRELKADAAANRGPWRAELTKPTEEQVVGTPANWTVRVVNAKGNGVADVPVSFTATDGTLSAAVPESQSPGSASPESQSPAESPAPQADSGANQAEAEDAEQAAPRADTQPASADTTAKKTTATETATETAQTGSTADQPAAAAETTMSVRTGRDGTAQVALTPTGEAPSLATTFASPNQTPRVQEPLRGEVQKVVLTGGEREITQTSTSTARFRTGAVQVRKVDAETGKPIAGASLRITAADRKAAAMNTDGEKLLGADGAPAVVQTKQDGTATVEDLRAPQEICVVEAAAPAGYEEQYDPKRPPSACGTITDGATLTLTVRNKPNAPQVPITIPAGGGASAVAEAAMESGPSTGGLLGFGGLLIVAAALGTLLVRRHANRR